VNYSKRHKAAFLVILASVVAGCSDGDLQKVIVSGKVTHKGEPIPNGQIRFTPINGTKGATSIASIIDGAYVLDGKGGVPVGKHRVSITAYRPRPNATPEELREGSYVQYLPAKYHADSQLECDVSDDSSRLTKNFDLAE